METSFYLRAVRDADLEKLAGFLSKGFPHSTPELWLKRFKMWWLNNPNFDPQTPLGWIIDNGEEEIFGFMGNISVKYQIAGKQGIAVGATSFFVDPALKGIWSIKIIYAFINQSDANLYLSTTPNEKIQKMLPHTGFSSLDFPFDNKELWYIIDFNKIYDLFLSKLKKSMKILFYITKVLYFPLKLIFPAIHTFRKKRERYGISEYHLCSVCTFCDDSFTELWEKSRSRHVTTLYRDASTLNWLYFSDAVKEKRYVIKCCEKNLNVLIGYMAFDLRSFGDTEARIMELKDIYIPKMERTVLVSLLSFSIHLAEKMKVSALRVWAANKEMSKILRKKFKIRRKYKLNYFYKFNENDAQLIKNQKNHQFIPSPIDPDRGTI